MALTRRLGGKPMGFARLALLASLAALLLLWSAAGGAAAHSGLVAVVPASDGTSALRLVFGEALEPRFSGADLVTADGRALTSIGTVDPSDPRVLLVTIPPSAAGPGGTELLIGWRALSAADGHVTAGALGLTGAPASVPGASTTRLHSRAHLSLEVLAKLLAFGGLLVALGLAPFARLVVRPVLGSVPRGLAVTQAGALVLAALGAVLLLAVDELELAAAGTVVDPVAYVAENRIGTILVLRTAVPLLGGAWLLLWLRPGAADTERGADRAAVAATAVGSVAAVVALGLTAISGHAAAYASPLPAVVDLVHLGAAGVWFGGLVGLAGLVGGPAPPSREAVRQMIPRFSGLALASVAVLGLTGLYAAWVSTGDWTRLGTPYSFGLVVKVVIVGSAFALGALSYLDGGRDLPLAGRTTRRLGIEAGLAMLVLVATASLTALEPPAPTRPVTIAPAGVEGPVSLSIAPGRAGPGLLVVGGPVPVGARVDLVPIARPGALDGSGANAGARVPIALDLRSLDGVAGIGTERARAELGAHVWSTVVLPAGRWQAMVALAPGGAPVAGFVFAIDEDGVTEGRLAPALPPPLVAGAGLIVLAILAGFVAVRGTALPNVERTAGRAALASLALVAGPLGAAILIVGPPG